MLHGQSANLFRWEGWAEALDDDHRVITVDLPGHGLTGPDYLERYTWRGIADNVSALTEVPTLVLWGGRDSWTLPKYADWFAKNLPDARVRTFPELGHMPMAEDPAATLVSLREFLR